MRSWLPLYGHRKYNTLFLHARRVNDLKFTRAIWLHNLLTVSVSQIAWFLGGRKVVKGEFLFGGVFQESRRELYDVPVERMILCIRTEWIPLLAE